MLHYRILVLVFVTMTCLLHTGHAQQKKKTVIKLDNPSFEGPPNAGARTGMYIPGWRDCGRVRFPGETAPDLQPGFFKVDTKAKDGNTYLGMVARDNESWESVTQALFKPLQAGTCYNFSLYITTSEVYSSPARQEGVQWEEAYAMGVDLKTIDHTDPIVLRIWGGANQCELTQLLGETEPVKNKNWKKFDFLFEPKQELRYIMLEAFFKTPSPFPQNGHLLIDNLSSIVGVPCSMEPPLVKVVKPEKKETTKDEKYAVSANLENVYSKADVILALNDKQFTDFKFDVATGYLTANIPLKNGNNKLEIKGRNSEGEDIETRIIKRAIDEPEVVAAITEPTITEPAPDPTINEETTLEGVEKRDLKKNQKLEIKNVAFSEDSYAIGDAYKSTLEKIANFLKANADVVIEIGGHTNNRCDEEFCLQLSENRAKAVMEYLISNDVDQNQLKSKGYGSLEPVASNNSFYGRKRNQRVEIKILDING
jgi:outer membrane protein OmpA-like peptidoglycan-associated protein